MSCVIDWSDWRRAGRGAAPTTCSTPRCAELRVRCRHGDPTSMVRSTEVADDDVPFVTAESGSAPSRPVRHARRRGRCRRARRGRRARGRGGVRQRWCELARGCGAPTRRRHHAQGSAGRGRRARADRGAFDAPDGQGRDQARRRPEDRRTTRANRSPASTCRSTTSQLSTQPLADGYAKVTITSGEISARRTRPRCRSCSRTRDHGSNSNDREGRARPRAARIDLRPPDVRRDRAPRRPLVREPRVHRARVRARDRRRARRRASDPRRRPSSGADSPEHAVSDALHAWQAGNWDRLMALGAARRASRVRLPRVDRPGSGRYPPRLHDRQAQHERVGER